MVGDKWESGLESSEDFKFTLSDFNAILDNPAFKGYLELLMSRYDAMTADLVVEENAPDVYRLQGRLRELGTILTLPETILGILTGGEDAEDG